MDTIQFIENIGVCGVIYASGSKPQGGHKKRAHPEALQRLQTLYSRWRNNLVAGFSMAQLPVLIITPARYVTT